MAIPDYNLAAGVAVLGGRHGREPRALFNVGATYATGKDGAEPDKDMAASFYERAAEHGNARAAATLGVMILTGEIVGTKEQSIAWLDRADAGGHDTWSSLDYAGVDDPREPAEDDDAGEDDSGEDDDASEDEGAGEDGDAPDA